MSMPASLRARLITVALSLSFAAGGAYLAADRPSAAIALAQEIGLHYESGGKHIGTPYVDKIGKGQPLTVCAGVTGKEVVAGRYYTREDCARLELPKYKAAERAAKKLFSRWATYNLFVQASIIDMIYNLGEAALIDSTLRRKANAGDLTGMCEQMPRWVYGTVRGQKVRLGGLVDRRGTTRELCAEWGQSGHFSAALIQEPKP